MSQAFVAAFAAFQAEVHATARGRGWWEGPRDDGQLIGLMHTEVSEALEALVSGNPADDKVPEFSGAEVELADVVLRIMDFAEARGHDVASAIVDVLGCPKGDTAGGGNFVTAFNGMMRLAGARAEATCWASDWAQIARLHFKLSKVLEALRIGNPVDADLPGHSAVAAGLARTLTCVMGYSARRGFRVAEAVAAKAQMNKGRAYKHGGKAF